jgi:hypothetical protein
VVPRENAMPSGSQPLQPQAKDRGTYFQVYHIGRGESTQSRYIVGEKGTAKKTCWCWVWKLGEGEEGNHEGVAGLGCSTSSESDASVATHPDLDMAPLVARARPN